jgi:hypothetical protein
MVTFSISVWAVITTPSTVIRYYTSRASTATATAVSIGYFLRIREFEQDIGMAGGHDLPFLFVS